MTQVSIQERKAWAARACQFFSADPVQCTISLTAISRSEFCERPHVELYELQHPTRLFAFYDPPWPLILSLGHEDAVRCLARITAERSEKLSAVTGPVALSEGFAATYEQTRRVARVGQTELRLYGTRQLWPPRLAPGRGRLARATDASIVTQFFQSFVDELQVPADPNPAARVGRAIADQTIVVWEDNDTLVSAAEFSRPIFSVSRVRFVFTPRSLRGRGYASSCAALATQSALQSGAETVCLFTDLANPTSNSIYQRIGYVPVTDFREIRFT